MEQKKSRLRIKLLGYVVLMSGLLLLGIALWQFGDRFTEMVWENSSGRTSPQHEAFGMLSRAVPPDVGGYTWKDWPSSGIRTGSLILVNGEHGTTDAEQEDRIVLYGNKSDSYQVKDRTVSLHKDVLSPLNSLLDAFREAEGGSDIMVLSGFRGREKQRELYEADLSSSGQSASAQTARPGYSEHETGYALDFSLYTRYGRTLDYDGTGKYEWIEENAYRYGFIRRYSGEKQELTNTIDEPWHYRFIGYPHALVMTLKGYCLEEYIDYLQGFPFEGEHLFVRDADGKQYEIYYVSAEDGETTRIPVPENRNYEVSGDNVSGFIITIET